MINTSPPAHHKQGHVRIAHAVRLVLDAQEMFGPYSYTISQLQRTLPSQWP